MNLKNQKLSQEKFQWIELKSKYEDLQKKLKQRIMEQLNEYNLLQRSLDIQLRNKQIQNKYDHERLTFNLENTQTTSKILNTIKDRFKNTSQQNQELVQETFKNKGFTNGWDSNLETQYSQNVKQSKDILLHEVKVSSWINIGMRNFIQNVEDAVKKNGSRVKLLEKYSDNTGLSAEEIKFIANTSQLLNSCLDKKQISKTVNIIDDKVIAQMEIDLSEDIIRRNQELNECLKNMRKKYLEEKNKSFQNKIKQNERQKIQENIEKQNKEERHKKRTRLEILSYQIDDKNERMIQINKNKLKQSLHNPIYRGMSNQDKFQEIKMAHLQENKNQKQIFLKKSRSLSAIIQPSQYKKAQNPKSEVYRRHLYHPPGKVLTQKPQIQYTDDGEQELKFKDPEVLKQIQNEFYIGLHASEQLRQKKQFIQFYSGGPIKPIRTQPLLNLVSRNNELKFEANQIGNYELKCIVKIQGMIRAFLCKKHKNKILKQVQDSNENKLDNYLRFLMSNQGKKSLKRSLSLNVPKRKSVFLMKACKIIKMNGITKNSPKLNEIVIPTKQSQKPVEILSSTRSSPLRKKLVQNEVDIKQMLLKNQKLLEACIKKKSVTYILSLGFKYSTEDINVSDNYGNSPLYYATKTQNYELCQWLLKQNANPNYQNLVGNSAVHISFESQSIELIMLIIENKGDLNLINQFQQTPLAFAKRETLKKLNMVDGVTTVLSKHIIFDNNKLLKQLNRNQIVDQHFLESKQKEIQEFQFL